MIAITSTFENVINLFHRVCRSSFHEFFIAGACERLTKQMDEELIWARGRPTSRFHQIDIPIEDGEEESPYLMSLTNSEYNFWKQYVAAGLRQRVCQLNQSAARHRAIKSGVQELHSLVSSPAIHFIDDEARGLRRWLSGFEMLFAMGFPVMNKFSRPLGAPTRTCSFGEVADEPVRIRNHMVAQAGNAMQVIVVGAAILYALLFVDVTSFPESSSTTL
jgi:hypothetical protein